MGNLLNDYPGQLEKEQQISAGTYWNEGRPIAESRRQFARERLADHHAELDRRTAAAQAGEEKWAARRQAEREEEERYSAAFRALAVVPGRTWQQTGQGSPAEAGSDRAYYLSNTGEQCWRAGSWRTHNGRWDGIHGFYVGGHGHDVETGLPSVHEDEFSQGAK